MKKIYAVQHSEHEPLGLWQEELERWHAPFEYIRTGQGQALPSPDNALGAIVLGGPMNVSEEKTYPFLRQEQDWLQVLIGKDIPVLGVCLGAQLLAAVLKAPVADGPAPEIGYGAVTLTPEGAEDTLLCGFPMALPVFQWHRQGFALPAGATRLAFSGDYACQAFRFKRAWGFQFHLEASADLVRKWAALARSENGPAPSADWDRLLVQTEEKGKMPALYGRQLIRRFWDALSEI